MSDGRAESGLSLKDAAAGRSAAGGDRAAHQRAVFPADRSILWTPRRDAGGDPRPAASGPYELFLTQSALRRVMAHAAEGKKEARFGFLLGRLFRCPESGVHYSVVNRSVPADEPFSEDAPNAFLLRAWAASQKEFRRHGGILAGWYHSHYLLGLFLSEGDLEMSERYFGQPWQCSLLVVPDVERPLGGVFRPEEGEEGAAGEPAAFRELLAAAAMPRSGSVPTAVTWTNYRPDREVVPLDPAAPDTVVETPQPSEPPPPVRPEHPPDAVTLVLPGDATERLFPRLPIRRLGNVWWGIGLAVVALLLLLVARNLLMTPRARTPAVRPPAVLTPEARRFRDAGRDLEDAMARYGERSQDFDLGRIGCELLSAGYGAADDAFIAMAGAFSAIGAATDSVQSAEYDRLVGGMNRVNGHFDESGCRRPE